MEDMRELNLDEMGKVAGGAGESTNHVTVCKYPVGKEYLPLRSTPWFDDQNELARLSLNTILFCTGLTERGLSSSGPNGYYLQVFFDDKTGWVEEDCVSRC